MEVLALTKPDSPILLYGLNRESKFVVRVVDYDTSDNDTDSIVRRMIRQQSHTNPARVYRSNSHSYTLLEISIKLWDSCIDERVIDDEPTIDKTASIVRSIRRQMREEKEADNSSALVL